ncbi:MAG TPA: CPBP family intramembrane glutamic endopeptidase [Symbiobacteriaceae bacterium]|nr:CPBP family intramembrane glutamic endopeptidase [Symbiobacteriaceae bacterium]
MKKLYARNAVLHSLVWLAFYLVLNTITDNLAGAMHIDFNTVSALPNLALAVVCYWFLRSTGISDEIGLSTKPTERSSVMLYYVPLLALPLLNLAYGINTSLSFTQVLLLLAMYSGVGFMEEIIFRGLMFKALEKKWNRYVVVAFISLTFAMGHIVSMAALGQTSADTLLQVINSLVVGFMFMAVILASGNLTICVIAHVLYNFLANLSLVGRTRPEIIVANTAITVVYFVYLVSRAGNVKAFFGSGDLQTTD